MSEVIDYGHFALGRSPTFTWIFQQEIASVWTTMDPAVAPVLNVTEDGVRTTKTLTHAGAGTYTWNPLFTVPGFYQATIYAPAGNGQDAQPFSFEVDPDPNYP
jgi:hypothetical protein